MGSLSQFRKAPHAKTYGIEYEFYVQQGELYGRSGPRPFNYGYRGMFYLTTDISINTGSMGGWPIEAISQPLPFNWLVREVKKFNGFPLQVRWNTSCGIHVHVSKKLVSGARMRALLTFLKTLPEHAQQAFFGRRYNGYCSPNSSTNSKYSIINFLHSNSYEFRMFASGPPDWAVICLQRTKLMVEYRGEYSVSNFYKLFGLTEG